MSFVEFDIEKENFNPFEKISKEWFLVTAGEMGHFNTMTASWGFMGFIWNKKCVITVIRPQRYTKEFIDNSEYFTICFFDETQRDALKFCGANSGRDCDKMAKTGLAPMEFDGCVGFEQAKTVLVCKKVYAQEMKEENFVDKELCKKNYPTEDYHTAYYGEIVKAYVKE